MTANPTEITAATEAPADAIVEAAPVEPAKPVRRKAPKNPAAKAKAVSGTRAIPAASIRNRHTQGMRVSTAFEEEEVLPMGGGGVGSSFGRCGGRVLTSRLEQQLCDRLSRAGVTHSHAPRHFEVRFGDKNVAAYAPQIVLRGRGREGKTVIIESTDEGQSPNLVKIEAFRRQYGLEFYVIFVAPEEVIDDVAVGVYDESCAANEINTLINRLAD